MVRSLADRTFQPRSALVHAALPSLLRREPAYTYQRDAALLYGAAMLSAVREVESGQVRKIDAAWKHLLEAKLKGSIGEGSNHSNFLHQSSVKILGIQRKPRKATSSK